MNSPLFQSEIFQKEIDNMFKELMTVSSMMGKFADFDIDGKKLFLEHMEGVTEKLRIVITRLRLADDAMGNEVLRMTGAQMLNANTNLEMMADGLRQQMEEMRAVIAREEATCDPAELAMIKRAWEERFPRTGQFDLGRVMSDPSIAEGFTDPQAIKAANEVASDPSKIENYRDRPALYDLLKATFGL